MVIEVIIEYFKLWSSVLIYPFFHFALLWRMIPTYLNGLLASIYFGPSNTAAVFGGLTALWAGADWIRGYIVGEMLPSQLNWAIAIIFGIYGVVALITGILKKKKLYWFFGRRSILTFFAISFYPIQAGNITLTPELIKAILIVMIPAILILELFAAFARKYILKVDDI
jgi:hypothetical protein